MYKLKDLILLSFWKPYEVREQLFFALMWPFIIGVFLDFTAYTLELNKIIAYIYSILEALIYIVIAITCHRLILLGNGSVSKYGINKWTLRETWFSFWFLILTYLIPFLLLKLFIYLIFVSVPSIDYIYYFTWFLAIFILILSFYLTVRLSLIFPHIALDNLNLNIIRWSWQLTRGHFFKIFTLIILVPIMMFLPFYLLGIIFEDIDKGSIPYLILTLFSTCLSYFLTIFVISTLSISYHWLMQLKKERTINT